MTKKKLRRYNGEPIKANPQKHTHLQAHKAEHKPTCKRVCFFPMVAGSATVGHRL